MKITPVRSTESFALKKAALQFAQKAGEPRFGLAILDDLLAAGEERQYNFDREQYRVGETERYRSLVDGESRFQDCREKVLDLLNKSLFFRRPQAKEPALLSGWELVGEIVTSDFKDQVINSLTPGCRDKAKALVKTLSDCGVLTRTVEMEKEYWTRQRMIWPEPTRDSCRLGKLGTHQLNLSNQTFD